MSNWGLSRPSGLSSFAAALTLSAGSSTAGAWVEATSSAPAGVVAIILQKWGANNNVPYAFDIGIGESGSQVLVADRLLAPQNDETNSTHHTVLPITVPAGSRVWLRAHGVGSTGTVTANLQFLLGGGLFPVAGFQVITRGMDSNYTGTALVSSTTQSALGTSVEYIASLDKPARAFGLVLYGDHNSLSFRGHMAIVDAAGNELAPRFFVNTGGSTSDNGNPFLSFIPCDLPVGANIRVAIANIRSTAAAQRGVILYTVH